MLHNELANVTEVFKINVNKHPPRKFKQNTISFYRLSNRSASRLNFTSCYQIAFKKNFADLNVVLKTTLFPSKKALIFLPFLIQICLQVFLSSLVVQSLQEPGE